MSAPVKRISRLDDEISNVYAAMDNGDVPVFSSRTSNVLPVEPGSAVAGAIRNMVSPFDRCIFEQAEKCFVHQGGRLQKMTGTFTGQIASGNSMKLSVNDGSQNFQR